MAGAAPPPAAPPAFPPAATPFAFASFRAKCEKRNDKQRYYRDDNRSRSCPPLSRSLCCTVRHLGVCLSANRRNGIRCFEDSAAKQCFDARQRETRRVACVDERGLRFAQRNLRFQQIENRCRSFAITSLLHAVVLCRCRNSN